MSGPLDSRLAKLIRGWALRFPSRAVLASFDRRVVGRIESHDDEIVIVVVHFRAAEWCLATAQALLASRGVRAKVFVVDNGGSTDLETRLPEGVTFVSNEKNLGYTGGANIVLREWLAGQDGEYVIVACHDLDLTPNAVLAMISVLAQDPRVGIVGPNRAHAEVPRDAPDTRISVSPQRWLNGSCLIFRRECLQDIGLLDEAFGSYVEDVDICFRAWDHGWAVVSCDDVIVATRGSASPKDHLIAKNSVLLAAKRRGLGGAAVEMLLQGVASALYLLSYAIHARDQKRRRESASGMRLRLTGIKDGAREALRARGQALS